MLAMPCGERSARIPCQEGVGRRSFGGNDRDSRRPALTSRLIGDDHYAVAALLFLNAISLAASR
jgi:hypothetical protein